MLLDFTLNVRSVQPSGRGVSHAPERDGTHELRRKDTTFYLNEQKKRRKKRK